MSSTLEINILWIAPVFIFHKTDNYKINNWGLYGIYVAAGNHYLVTFYFICIISKEKKRGGKAEYLWICPSHIPFPYIRATD